MLKTRYIILSVFFSLILFSSLLLFHLNFFFEAIFVLSSLSIILFILILKFYKFYHDSLSLLKEENIYINNTVISFLLNPKNDEALYMLILIKIDQSDYKGVEKLIKQFTLVCDNFCSKENEIKNKFNKLTP